MKKIIYFILILSLVTLIISCSVPTTLYTTSSAAFLNYQLVIDTTWIVYEPGKGWKAFCFQKGSRPNVLGLSYSNNTWLTKEAAILEVQSLRDYTEIPTTNPFDDFDSLYYYNTAMHQNWIFRFSRNRKFASLIIKEKGLSPEHFSMIQAE
ncbi:MAG: hypothetical protein ACRCVN_04815 [Spirochaetia bacterium]